MDDLLLTHPNDITHSLSIPSSWYSWWSWSQTNTTEPPWLSLVKYYIHNDIHSNIPLDLQILIRSIKSFQLDRIPAQIQPLSSFNHASFLGMSPKKVHEVIRMSSYISHLIHSLPYPVTHVVDLGSGQAYLSRFLQSHLSLHVLALDSNDSQTRAAQRWSTKLPNKHHGSITHKTIHITSQSLHAVIDDWILPTSSHNIDRPIPVLLVALHACGSLTPDILRFFIAHCRSPTTTTWTPCGIVAVGCCYNLMSPSDFPLSKTYSSRPSLPISALHLAAQLPAHWLTTPKSQTAATLAIRKVVWRALLQRSLNLSSSSSSEDDPSASTGTGSKPINRRLGRLPDSAYTDWQTFLRAASIRLGIPSDNIDTSLPPTRVDESPLEVLHVLRCLLGPFIESLIIKDRVSWVREQLAEKGAEEDFSVDLVNLFDQGEGSARNVGIVICSSNA